MEEMPSIIPSSPRVWIGPEEMEPFILRASMEELGGGPWWLQFDGWQAAWGSREQLMEQEVSLIGNKFSQKKQGRIWRT